MESEAKADAGDLSGNITGRSSEVPYYDGAGGEGVEATRQAKVHAGVRGPRAKEVMHPPKRTRERERCRLAEGCEKFASCKNGFCAAHACYEPAVYGRERDKQKLVELLLSDECRRKVFSFVSIVADGGMGKTTLARLVYGDSLVCNRFDLRCWVCLSWINDIEELLRAVVESVSGVSCDLNEPNQLLEVAAEELMGKRLLLVLDNYCKGDGKVMSDIYIRFSQICTKGSIVLITARKNMVKYASRMSRFYDLNPVSDDDCFCILQDYAVAGRNPDFGYGPVKFDHVMRAACGGNPLSARLLGGLLYFNIINANRQLGDDATNEPWKSDKSGDSVLRALRFSFSFLPEHLRKCFLYCCSLFPKDHLFEKDHIVQLWMSQGLVEPENGKKDDIGNRYFDDLVLRSFFQVSPIGDAKKRYYQMHDLVHDLALSIFRGEALQLKGSKQFSFSDKLYHRSLIPCGLEYTIDVESLKGCSSVCSLLLINRSFLNWNATRIHIKNPGTFKDLFQNLVCIRTLDLSFSNINELPCTIHNLENLCYLGLNYTRIRYLPESLCCLHKLQTLGLQNCPYLNELPKDLKNLIGLRRLDIWKKSGCVSIPQGIGDLRNLQILTAFNVGEDELHSSISELKNLVNLKGKLHIGGLNYVLYPKDAAEANMFNKPGLKDLTLQWSSNILESESNLELENASEVFESLQPHVNLEELTVRNYPGDKFPKWMGSPLFSNLVSLTLDNSYNSEVLPMLGQLVSLKYLFIRKMDRVQRVGREFCGSDHIVMNSFPSLKILKIWEMYDWEDWHGVEHGDFPRLHSLYISRCYKLRCLPHFQSLIKLSLHSFLELPVLSLIPSLNFLTIEDFQKISSLNLPMKLSSLQTLEVKNCSQLLYLEGLLHMVSLKKLTLAKCPKLDIKVNEKLPLALEVVHIHRSCSMLMSWCPSGFYPDCEVHQACQRRLIRNAASEIQR